MFNLFKKAKKENQQQVIEAIHNEFDLAGEKLLAEAKEILASEFDTSKGEILARLGFSSSKSAIDAKTISDIKKKNLEIAERVEYFKTYYPSYKFITEEMVEQICKKYNLICGPSHNYIGDIPSKNVNEIEKFVLREEDMEVRTNMDDYYERMRWQSLAQFDRSNPIYQSPPTELIEKRYKLPFKICAPLKDFDTTYMTIKNGYSLVQIPDPVVLQPVKGGYLVISKWGIEADDELLVNETNN